MVYKESVGQATLYRIQLHTGRTHQIRVHSAYLKHPLLGDRLYDGAKVLPLQRQALHCAYLRFYHPFLEKDVEFTCELPRDMQQYLANN